MKRSRIATIILSAFMALNAVSVLPAGAITAEDFSEEKFAAYTRIEDFQWLAGVSYIDSMYMDYKDDGSVTMYSVERYPDIIYFTATSGVSGSELAARVQSVNKDLVFDSAGPVSDGKYMITAKDERIIEPETAKELFGCLSDIVESFDYRFGRYVYTYSVYKYMTAYLAFNHDFSIEDKLREYIAENDIAAEIIKRTNDTARPVGSGDMFFLVPAESLTPLEHYELAKSIYEATGMCPSGLTPEGISHELSGHEIDMKKFLDGDADCDGKVKINDAVLIMQSLTNPDKYTLTEQGKFNADTDYNGITNYDALNIQKKLLGLM